MAEDRQTRKVSKDNGEYAEANRKDREARSIAIEKVYKLWLIDGYQYVLKEFGFYFEQHLKKNYSIFIFYLGIRSRCVRTNI